MAVRKCTSCHDIMGEGYVVFGGEAYYCTDKCLHTVYTPDEWADIYENGYDDSYYTLWYDCNAEQDDIELLFEAMQNGQYKHATDLIGAHYEDDQLDIYKGLTALFYQATKGEN